LSLLAELKRRNVIRMACLYLVGAWLLVQVTGTVLPWFGVPESLLRGLVVVLAIGLLPALAFAWIYELTPEGLKRDDEVDPTKSITPRTARRMNHLIVAGLVIAVAYFAIDKFVLAPKRDAARTAPVAATTATAIAGAPASTTVSDKSVAVLPFENLSSDPDNAYFATGMQDEILTRLSKVGALKVISRTSTINIASKPANLPEIAMKLGVAAILEGSVQKAGNNVHINVQLIRAATDEHLWADSYNRKLDDVFAMQGEVAQAVAEALNAALTRTEKDAIDAKPTNNTKAYEFYLRGLALEARFSDQRADIEKRVVAYEKAVELDPDFALAWALLASARTEIYFSYERSPAYLETVKQALDHAQRLAPDATETWKALGAYHYFGLQDYDGAFEAFSKALKTRPNDGLIVYTLGNVRRRQGHWNEALELQTKAAKLDPLATNTWLNLGMTLRALRRYADAHAAFDRGLAAVPGDPELLNQKFFTWMAAGDVAAARSFVQSAQAKELPVNMIANYKALVHVVDHDYPPAIAALRDALAQRDHLPERAVLTLLGLLAHVERLGGERESSLTHAHELRQLLLAQREKGNKNPYQLFWLSRMSAILGERDESYRQSDDAVAGMANDALGLPQTIESQAFARMLGGDLEQAVALLRKMQSLPATAGTSPALLRIDPTWDPLRKTPGFDALLVDGGIPLRTE